MFGQPIPLSLLVPSHASVRRTGAVLSLDELAASIAAHGLLQNLQVRAGEDGKFRVVAGKRRLLALKRLAKSGLRRGKQGERGASIWMRKCRRVRDGRRA